MEFPSRQWTHHDATLWRRDNRRWASDSLPRCSVAVCEPALLLRRTGKLTWAFSTCNNLKYYLEPNCHSGYVVWNVSFPLSAASSSITIISNSRRMRRLKWRATGETHFDPFISNLQWGQLAQANGSDTRRQLGYLSGFVRPWRVSSRNRSWSICPGRWSWAAVISPKIHLAR